MVWTQLRQEKPVLLGLSGCEVRHADEKPNEKDEKHASNSFF
jgi:hypothetical protein